MPHLPQQSPGVNVATRTDVALLCADLAAFRADIYRALWIQGAVILVGSGVIMTAAVAAYAALP